MNDDSNFIEQSLNGDHDAFGHLVRKYQDRLFNALVHLAGSVEEAKDVVQEAFIQAFTRLETFQGKSAFYTWLYRIAYNTWVSHRRKHQPTVSIDYSKEVAGEEPIDPIATTDRLEQDELAAQIERGMAALSEEHRTILVMREVEGFDYDSIAETLNLPVGTVRSRLFRARSQLRDLLKEVFQEDFN